jgi:hypothetical protein
VRFAIAQHTLLDYFWPNKRNGPRAQGRSYPQLAFKNNSRHEGGYCSFQEELHSSALANLAISGSGFTGTGLRTWWNICRRWKKGIK